MSAFVHEEMKLRTRRFQARAAARRAEAEKSPVLREIASTGGLGSKVGHGVYYVGPASKPKTVRKPSRQTRTVQKAMRRAARSK